MVHSHNDVKEVSAKKPDESTTRNIGPEGIIYPEFSVDDDGIPYCKSQTDYEKIKSMNLKERFPNEFEKVLTCTRCEHYQHDDCYFPKQEIDKIEEDRQKLNIRCALCGMKIHRLYSIMMSLFYKDRFGVNIPVVCCTCYAALENGSYMKNSKRRMILFFISFLLSIYFLVAYFLTVQLFDYLVILLFIFPFSFFTYIAVRDAKNLYYLYKGRKYYQSIMGAQETAQEKTRRDEMLDEEDRQPPPAGAYDPPGYHDD